jgi:hypothetical protein
MARAIPPRSGLATLARLAVRLAPLAGVGLGCETDDIVAVDAPGGVFRPGAGCDVSALAAGAAAGCTPSAQLGFEHAGDDAAFEPLMANLSRREVSCARSFCGTGSLHLFAQFHRRAGVEPASELDYLGELSYQLPQPTDLFGKMLSFKLYIDGPDTPINAMIAVVDEHGLWHKVHDLPVYGTRKWHERGAPISFENPMLTARPSTPSLTVTQLRISVYLATDVRSGDNEHWSGDIFIDEVGWY